VLTKIILVVLQSFKRTICYACVKSWAVGQTGAVAAVVVVNRDLEAALAGSRRELVSSSAAERVAALLRSRITEGLFAPGSRLPEELLVRTLGISRNTIREAFRLLSHERLVTHELNRGVFVRELEHGDVVDLYRLRRLVEGGAVRFARESPLALKQAVMAAVEEAEAAAARGDWLDVRTADLHFHQSLGALAGSPRVDEVMARALAELRLAFGAITDPQQFHEPYVARNRAIADLVIAGRGKQAERELTAYLADAERQLLELFQSARHTSSP